MAWCQFSCQSPSLCNMQELLPLRPGRSAPLALVTGDADGLVSIFAPSGELLGDFDSGETCTTAPSSCQNRQEPLIIVQGSRSPVLLAGSSSGLPSVSGLRSVHQCNDPAATQQADHIHEQCVNSMCFASDVQRAAQSLHWRRSTHGPAPSR